MSASRLSGSVWVIVVAGGQGRRFGRPKQFEKLAGKLVLEWSIDAARAVADGVVLVVPSDQVDDASVHGHADVVVAGGAERSDSVRAGLRAVPEDATVVMVHDAARPLASSQLFQSVLGALADGPTRPDGAIPALFVTDTIKRVVDGKVIETLDRSELMAVQTPQAFRAEALRKAHADNKGATDDAALLEAIGATVVVVFGEEHNTKLTSADDVEAFEAYLLAVRDQRLS